MFSSISKEQFKNYKKKGFNRIPLLVEASSDLDSPLSIFTKLANHPYSYLLESVEGGDNFGRYSIVGLPSKIQIKINWTPQVSLETSLTQTIHWFIERYG